MWGRLGLQVRGGGGVGEGVEENGGDGVGACGQGPWIGRVMALLNLYFQMHQHSASSLPQRPTLPRVTHTHTQRLHHPRQLG